jgi:hypothetical protein
MMMVDDDYTSKRGKGQGHTLLVPPLVLFFGDVELFAEHYLSNWEKK